jgi:hypothetical protein
LPFSHPFGVSLFAEACSAARLAAVFLNALGIIFCAKLSDSKEAAEDSKPNRIISAAW